MENLRAKVNASIQSNNHRMLINLMNGPNKELIPNRILNSMLIKKFCNLIESYGKADILVRRNVEVRCTRAPTNSNASFIVEFINRDNSDLIARVNCGLYIERKPKTFFYTRILLGRTENRYSKTGNLRPVNNGPGYGTIIRAFICAASKKLGALATTQTSAFLNQKNKQAAIAGTLNQPVSAYIMNKLGFSKNTNRNLTDPLAPHERKLFYKNMKVNNWPNLPTPELNSVMNSIITNGSWK